MDPKKIWQDQPTEPSTVTMVLIRQKARELHRKTRRELLNTALGHLFIAAFCVIGIAISPRLPAPRIALGIAFVWGLVGAWVSHRGMWAPPMPGDAGFETGIEFYRQEIRRQSLLFRRWLVWSLGPILLATAAIIAIPLVAALQTNPRILRNAIPFFTLLAIWAVVVAVIRKRRKRDLEREIDELKEIEKESRS